jgi:hypothetical protein
VQAGVEGLACGGALFWPDGGSFPGTRAQLTSATAVARAQPPATISQRVQPLAPPGGCELIT